MSNFSAEEVRAVRKSEMAERMTLEQVRDALFACGKGHGFDNNQIDMLHGFARVIDAHLTRPAQAVDVGAIRAVITNLRTWHDEGTDSMADTLTSAIGNALAIDAPDSKR